MRTNHLLSESMFVDVMKREKSITQFNSLSLQEKCRLVDAYAIKIHHTDYNDYRINLYVLAGEYVELWFDIYRNHIWRIRIPSFQELDIHLYTITINS